LEELAPIIERCRKGDALAWEALVRRHQARVYGVAFHYLRDGEEARDLAQEVFVKVYKNLDSFKGDAAFLPWLLRMARNAAIDRIRRQKARPPADDLQVGDAVELQSNERSPEQAWEADVGKRLVHRALGRMSEQNREIILLKDIQGLKLEEIAEMLGVPLGTVKSRSSRARTELAKRVVELDPSYGAVR